MNIPGLRGLPAYSMTRPEERPRVTLGRLADEFGLQEITDHPHWRGIVVTSVRQDNRLVVGGSLFVAVTGARVHGARFAADALARGAVAVLTDRDGAASLMAEVTQAPARLGPDAPFLVTRERDPQSLGAILGRVAARVLDHPADKLTSFGVTGTNGKTTVAYMVDHVLRAQGRTTGLVGTIETRVADQVVASQLTTPQAVDLQHLLARMVEVGASHLSMEVSSHALELDRVRGLRYEVAGFTNLTQDHLDFHETFEEYYAAKAALFDAEHSERGVVLVDDRWGRRLYCETRAARGARVTALRVAEPGDAPEDREAAGWAREHGWTVTDVAHTLDPQPGTRSGEGARTAFTLRHADGRALRTWTSLPGSFNVANAALAVAMVLEAGNGSAEAARALEEALARAGGVSPLVPGRMELVSESGQPRVLVDFAHNTGALETALASLGRTTRGRLLVAFGAAGERDAGKRPDMGRVAVRGADVVVVTDDDPYGEDPAAIRAQVLAGAREAQDAGDARALEVHEIAPREDAIAALIAQAHDNDTVLIAGRGHETVQTIGGVAHEIDDRDVARRALAARSHSRSSQA